MKQRSNQSLLKNPVLVILIAIVIVLTGGMFYLSQTRSSNSISQNGVKQSGVEAENEMLAQANPQYGEVHALFKNPTDGAILMGTHKGLFKSTDGGKSFTQVNAKGVMSGMEFMSFAYDPNSKILFAGGHDLGVVKSTDGGVSWEKSDSGITGSDIHALSLNPLEESRVYAFSVSNGVFGSKDSGKSWNRIDDGPNNPSVRSFGYMGTASPMDRSMKTDQTTNIGYLWAGTGGGLYSSFACFCGWTKATGISDNATIYTIAPDPVNKSSMLAGTKDGIFKTTDEGKTFTKISSDVKNTASISFDVTDPKVVYAATSDALIYKSQDDGNTWSKIN